MKMRIKLLIMFITFVVNICNISVVYGADMIMHGDTLELKKKDKPQTKPQLTKYKFKSSDGNVYDVYKSSRGSLFYLKKSKKTNKPYKVYLDSTTNEQINKIINNEERRTISSDTGN